MTAINVQFSDAAGSAVITYFGSPQDPGAYPNQGTLDASDPRWKAWYDSVPSCQPFLPAPVSA